MQHANLATILMGVDMRDAYNGYIGGSQDGVGPIMLKTEDGGETLENTIDDPFAAPGIIMAVSSLNGSSAITAGVGAWWGLLGPGASYTENGENWYPAEDMTYLAIAFQDSDVADESVFLPGMWYNNTVNEGCGCAVSHDGGKSYAKYDWGLRYGPYCEQARYASFLTRDVGYMSGGHWPGEKENIVIGNPEDLYHFSQFIRLPVPHQDELDIEAIEAFNGRYKQANEDGFRAVVAKTIDGGVTWDVVHDLQNTDWYYNSISFINETHGCVVGEGDLGAHIFCTSNSGADFVETWTHSSASLLALDFVAGSLEGWAGGMWVHNQQVTALFLHTIDGGQTWEAIDDASFAPGHIIAVISMATNEHGNAVALNLASSSSALRFD
jgi:photosystem II stability/assembly factor-like uncharacterized protein